MSYPAIFTVYGGKEARDFLNAPFLRVISRKGRPEPPKIYTKRLLDADRNPFFLHGRMERFVARELLTPKGRVAVFIDDSYNSRYGLKRGWFGYFESLDDPDAGRSLMRPALGWLRDSGMDEAVGPIGLTPLAWPGIGPGTPHYYTRLMEGAGFLPLSEGAFASIDSGAVAPQPAAGADVRVSDISDPLPDMELLCSIFHEISGPGLSTTVTPEAIMYLWKFIRGLVNKGGMIFAHSGGATEAAALVIPNIGLALSAMNGKIIPFGWLKYLINASRPQNALVFGPYVKDSADFSRAMSALLPEIVSTSRGMGAKTVVFHDSGGENGRVMAELAGLGPEISPGHTVYSIKLK